MNLREALIKDTTLWEIALVLYNTNLKDLLRSVRCKMYRDEQRRTQAIGEAIQIRAQLRTLLSEAIHTLVQTALVTTYTSVAAQPSAEDVLRHLMATKHEMENDPIESDLMDAQVAV
jgi:hypothetical protein